MNLTDSDRQMIRSVITQQLEAFQQDDSVGAFACASPGIQTQFDNPEKFMAMVKLNYEAVYRPRSVLFETIAEVEGYPAQKVLLMTPNGTLLRAVYLMQQQPDDSWRIHGCLLMPMEESFGL
ncbi:DUF4864 domain-containing protein [Oscillatoria sp. FACHB-1407]|uniref:DUF4864 domain-containing protein n=1 Tax=Oscillatoria sp. FACHB-1407 TaxID=2692847 RepID=UPI001689734D|nr:DUF4864 domain-containing protein [Oscillatoria sp. FACHB-1407]MBD2464411.1 DUF4864 domain-containing protein [Oscillatoria sp. FACHB-1407]